MRNTRAQWRGKGHFRGKIRLTQEKGVSAFQRNVEMWCLYEVPAEKSPPVTVPSSLCCRWRDRRDQRDVCAGENPSGGGADVPVHPHQPVRGHGSLPRLRAPSGCGPKQRRPSPTSSSPAGQPAPAGPAWRRGGDGRAPHQRAAAAREGRRPPRLLSGAPLRHYGRQRPARRGRHAQREAGGAGRGGHHHAAARAGERAAGQGARRIRVCHRRLPAGPEGEDDPGCPVVSRPAEGRRHQGDQQAKCPNAQPRPGGRHSQRPPRGQRGQRASAARRWETSLCLFVCLSHFLPVFLPACPCIYALEVGNPG